MKNRYKIKGEITEIYLNNSDEIVLIDTEDLCILEKINHTFSRNKLGYAQWTEYIGRDENGKHKYKTQWLHILIIGEDKVKRGESVIDHINHNGLDNRKENLRITTQSQNMMNRPKKNNNNKSGYRNVCWFHNKWIVQLMVNGKRILGGKFDDLDEAVRCAEELRQKYFGEFAGES
ncbi:MAG: HNH endonuclease [Bacilli bacterium]|nr:HNH endonuclease [Bacilli bacterium]